MAFLKNPRLQKNLDAIRNLNHWTYRVPGLTSWTIILGFLGMIIWAPNIALEIARLVGFYTLFRIGWIVLFYLVGLIKVLNIERRGMPARFLDTSIFHLVVIPNYKEPLRVLEKTLGSLSQNACARTQMVVVLAMEGRDEMAESVATTLAQRFSDQFLQIIVTYHPANLPEEIPAKAANQTWAVRHAKAELVDQLGMDIQKMIVTTCDADSTFHPAYFDELARLFAADDHPHNRIWHAPVMLDSNLWEVPVTIRLLTYFLNAGQLSELTNPLSFAMPISTYSLSLKLVDEIGYWDPVVISDDYHMYLRCMFALRGNLKLISIFLPVHGETVNGETRWQAWTNYYKQKVRHSWGSEDTAYIIQQWNQNPGTPFLSKITRLSKMFFDHNLPAFLPVIFFMGTGLAIYLRGEPILTIAVNYAFPPIVLISNGFSVFTTIVLWLVEHWRCSRKFARWKPGILVGELATWILVPFVSLVLICIPILHAQTKMLFASPLVFARTPKGLKYEAP